MKKRYREWRIIFNNDFLLKGGVYIIKHTCGKPNCKCATTTYRHANYYLYRSEGGKNTNKYIKAENLATVRKLTGNYIKFRKARASLMKIQQEMSEIFNQLEKEKTIQFFREGKIEKKKKKNNKKE